MDENAKSFLNDLRSLSEAAKRRIVIVAAIVVMIVVFYVWLGYFNGFSPENSQASITEAMPQPSSTGYSFWGGLINIFRNPGQYVVNPK